MATYGYRKGERDIVTAKVDSSTSAIVTNDILTLATAGYVKRASAGDGSSTWPASRAARPARPSCSW